jgi:hypothetical protein
MQPGLDGAMPSRFFYCEDFTRGRRMHRSLRDPPMARLPRCTVLVAGFGNIPYPNVAHLVKEGHLSRRSPGIPTCFRLQMTLWRLDSALCESRKWVHGRVSRELHLRQSFQPRGVWTAPAGADGNADFNRHFCSSGCKRAGCTRPPAETSPKVRQPETRGSENRVEQS